MPIWQAGNKMYKQEEIKPYHEGDKGRQVEAMFDNIALTYDTLNHRLSWDIDKYWRKKAIRQLAPYRPENMLDVATGTADFALQAAKMLKPVHLIGSDISEGMMKVGEEKVKAAGLSQIISFVKEDCMRLSFADNSFDAVTAAFGIRNFPDLDQVEGDVSRAEEGRPPECRRTDDTCFIPDEAVVLALCQHGAPPLWQNNLQ